MRGTPSALALLGRQGQQTLLCSPPRVLRDYLACNPLHSSPQPAFDGHFNRHHLIFIGLLRRGFFFSCRSVSVVNPAQLGSARLSAGGRRPLKSMETSFLLTGSRFPHAAIFSVMAWEDAAIRPAAPGNLAIPLFNCEIAVNLVAWPHVTSE